MGCPSCFVSSKVAANALEKHSDLRGDANELLAPEVVLGIAQKLDESHKSSPRMRAMDNEAFQKHLRQDLAEAVFLVLSKEVKEQGAEPMSVSVRVAEVKDN